MSNEPEFKKPLPPKFTFNDHDAQDFTTDKKLAPTKDSTLETLQINRLSPYSQVEDRFIQHTKTEPEAPSIFPLPDGPQVASKSTTARKKVTLEPGHSPLDWARLITSGKDLRGVNSFQRISREELAKHSTLDDVWCAINGKVYNITPYLKFHPGGVKQLMKGAGKDATVIYNKVHPWVNVDSLLGPCFIGPFDYS